MRAERVGGAVVVLGGEDVNGDGQKGSVDEGVDALALVCFDHCRLVSRPGE